MGDLKSSGVPGADESEVSMVTVVFNRVLTLVVSMD